MFEGATDFDKDLKDWRPNTELPATGLNRMFYGATKFSQNLCNWNTVEFTSFTDGTDTFTNTACNPATLTNFDDQVAPAAADSTACAECDS